MPTVRHTVLLTRLQSSATPAAQVPASVGPNLSFELEVRALAQYAGGSELHSRYTEDSWITGEQTVKGQGVGAVTDI